LEKIKKIESGEEKAKLQEKIAIRSSYVDLPIFLPDLLYWFGENGLPVSLDTEERFFFCADRLHTESSGDVREILRMLLCRSREDEELFERDFHLFFHPEEEKKSPGSKKIRKRLLAIRGKKLANEARLSSLSESLRVSKNNEIAANESLQEYLESCPPGLDSGKIGRAAGKLQKMEGSVQKALRGIEGGGQLMELFRGHLSSSAEMESTIKALGDAMLNAVVLPDGKAVIQALAGMRSCLLGELEKNADYVEAGRQARRSFWPHPLSGSGSRRALIPASAGSGSSS
jgi:hypothetical protein